MSQAAAFTILLLFIKAARSQEEEKQRRSECMCGLWKRASSGMFGSVPENELFVWSIISLASSPALHNRRGKKTRPELSCSLFSWKTNYFLLVKHFLRRKTAARAKCGALSKTGFRREQMHINSPNLQILSTDKRSSYDVAKKRTLFGVMQCVYAV